MTQDLLIGFCLFAVVTLFTPGPNNVMLMTSALNHGVRKTQPHLIGVVCGFSLMVLLVGLGLGAVFVAFPVLHTVLEIVGAAYLLYLAWRIANSGPVKDGKEQRGRPMTFLEAVAFQWVNPKAWVMSVGAVSTYAAIAGFPFNMILMAAIFAFFGVLSSITWVVFGSGLRHIVKSPRSVRIFNIVMALLLVASLYPVLAGAWT